MIFYQNIKNFFSKIANMPLIKKCLLQGFDKLFYH